MPHHAHPRCPASLYRGLALSRRESNWAQWFHIDLIFFPRRDNDGGDDDGDGDGDDGDGDDGDGDGDSVMW